MDIDLDIKIMKEKIKKLGLYLCPWKFNIHLNIGFVLFHIIQMIMEFHIANLVGVTFHLGFLSMICFLESYDKRHLVDRAEIDLIRTIAGDLAYDLKRYRQLYGELPAEEAESEKQNSENPSQAER